MRKITLLLLLIFASETTFAGSVIRMKPFLQSPVNKSITVSWMTKVPALSYVEYGTDTTNLKKAVKLINGQMVANNLINHIKLENLEPNKKYYYRAISKEITHYGAYKKKFGAVEVSGFHSFVAPPVVGQSSDFTAVIFNDLHQNTKTAQALVKAIKDVKYDFVIFNGDCIDDPVDEKQVVTTVSILNQLVQAEQIPVIYLRGNHEIRNAYSVKLYDILQTIAGERSYGAFSWGNSRFVLLDCGEDKPDQHPVYYGMNDFSGFRKDQQTFLNDEVNKKLFKKADCKILVHHIPLYDKYSVEDCVGLWGELLNKSKIDCSINAHTHEITFRPKGEMGNNYPVFIGGGPKLDKACVTIVEKRGDILNIRQVNTKSEIVNQLNIQK